MTVHHDHSNVTHHYPFYALHNHSLGDWFTALGSSTYSVLVPEPISPLFKEGGIFEGFNEDLMQVVICTLALFIIDNILIRHVIVPKARYFALHTVANFTAVVAAFPDVRRAIMEPDGAIAGSMCTMWANSAVAAIHLYHCLAFPLRAEDIWHHVQFVVVLCGAAVPYKHKGGICQNWGAFFLSGLPGGLDYILLVLVAHGKMAKMTEKRLNAHINVWLRGPAMAVLLVHGWQQMIYHPEGFDWIDFPMLIGICVLQFSNGAFYSRQAVESYATWAERERRSKLE